jgi:hypothetical protein
MVEAAAAKPQRYRGLVERMVGAAMLRFEAFAEMSADAGAGGQAFLVVLIVGVFNGFGLVRRLGSWGLSAGVASAILGWLLWTAVIYVVCRSLGHRLEGRSLLRAMALTNAPGLFLVFGIMPVLGMLVRAVVVLWQLAATAVAVQAVYSVSLRRGVAVALLGLLVYLLVGAGLAMWLADDGDSRAPAVTACSERVRVAVAKRPAW